jgi:ATP/maltotriose-dependent transcriptional regulator MalT
MWHTKLNTPVLTSDLIPRPHLYKKLENKTAVPLILISAPAGYGKSVLVSQWIKEIECANAWLSIDESMNDPATFLTYLGALLNRSIPHVRQEIKTLEKEYNFLSWDAIIEIIINSVNKLEERTRLILDDYHLISNKEIHKLVQVLISEEIKNLQLIIISRWDPPFQLQKLRLYHKIYELRMSDLRFKKEELTEFLTLDGSISLSNDEIKTVIKRTEGWILVIRMILLAKSFPNVGNKKKDLDILTKDLDMLMSYISDSLDPDFFRQMQLCALCDQFSVLLIDSICAFAFEGACKGEVFLAKLTELNFFIIPTTEDGKWYRFHHLFGEILTLHLKKDEPDIIIPLYLHISSWFSARGHIFEAIQYAIKGGDFKLASDLIIEHKAGFLDKGEWWVVQRWLDKIPRQIRNSNVNLLLTELLVCEETWNIEDFFHILGTLKSVGIENLSDENISLYLFHLGYFLTFVHPDPKKAVESIERSKALCPDERYMFGARRELILACSRQMLGLTALALQSLDEIQEKSNPSSKLHIRSIHGKVLVHLLSGNFESANNESKKMLFLVQDSDLLYAKGWGSYFLGNVAFQSYNEYEAIQALNEVLEFEGLFNYRVYFDALAGLILISSLNKDEKTTALLLKQMKLLASKMKDIKFQDFCHSVQARVNWHNGQGGQELSWAKADWAKQHPSSYLFLIDVPEITKIRILISHGSHTQVEEAISVLDKVEAMMSSVHNHYQMIDIFLLKAMGFLRLERKKLAAKWLEKALMLVDKKDMIRPILEATRVMPSLFKLLDRATPYSILTRMDFGFATQKSPKISARDSYELTLREQELIKLVAKGFKNKQIANQLHISIFTVKTHLSNIYRKLDVPNRTSMLNKILNQNIFTL